MGKSLACAALLAAVLSVGCALGCKYGTVDREAESNRSLISHTVELRHVVAAERTRVFPAPAEGETVDAERVEVSWTGSGTIVAEDRDADEGLVLTAGHVCKVPDDGVRASLGESGIEIYAYVFKTKVINVTYFDGYSTVGVVASTDYRHDVCVIWTAGTGGTVAPIAAEMPPIGARVQNPGSPHGIMEADAVPLSEGFYSGTVLASSGMEVEMDVSLVTVPAGPGSSGSGVYYRGRLFGLVSMGHARYEHGTYCAQLQWIRKVVSFAERDWHAR